eukprot:scaffold7944_cov131-Isochrysis_galbana.AAC.10
MTGICAAVEYDRVPRRAGRTLATPSPNGIARAVAGLIRYLLEDGRGVVHDCINTGELLKDHHPHAQPQLAPHQIQQVQQPMGGYVCPPQLEVLGRLGAAGRAAVGSHSLAVRRIASARAAAAAALIAGARRITRCGVWRAALYVTQRARLEVTIRRSHSR